MATVTVQLMIGIGNADEAHGPNVIANEVLLENCDAVHLDAKTGEVTLVANGHAHTYHVSPDHAIAVQILIG